MRELVRQIGLRESLIDRDGQKMDSAVGRHVGKERDWCASDMDYRGNIPALQLLQARDLLFVFDLCLDAECIEQNLGRHCRAAANDVDVDPLAAQVLDPRDVLAGEDMNFLIVQLGDVSNALCEVGEHAVLLRVCQRIGLDKADVDTFEVENVG